MLPAVSTVGCANGVASLGGRSPATTRRAFQNIPLGAFSPFEGWCSLVIVAAFLVWWTVWREVGTPAADGTRAVWSPPVCSGCALGGVPDTRRWAVCLSCLTLCSCWGSVPGGA